MKCDHTVIQQLGSVAWCARCGALRTGEVADWRFPESEQPAARLAEVCPICAVSVALPFEVKGDYKIRCGSCGHWIESRGVDQLRRDPTGVRPPVMQGAEEVGTLQDQSTCELAWTLELPKLFALPYHGRNLSVQVHRSYHGDYHAVLVDLGEFRGAGSVQSLAIDDLVDELEHVAAEIRRESGKVEVEFDLARVRAVYSAALTWRRGELRTGLSADPSHMITTIDAAIFAEDTAWRASQ